MRPLNKIIAAAAMLLLLNACAVGGGNGPEEESGLAAMSLQLHGLEEGEIYLSNDGYRLSFDHFALAFSSISLGEFETQAAFGADFFDEEVADIVEIEAIPAGEYEALSLTWGLGEGGVQRFLQAKGMKRAETLPPNLQGLSVFLEAGAVNGDRDCTLQVALAADGESFDVDPDGNHVAVEAGEEVEILVEADPNAVFAGIDLTGLCQDGDLVSISEEENSGLAARIKDNLAGSFLLGSTEGHHHH